MPTSRGQKSARWTLKLAKYHCEMFNVTLVVKMKDFNEEGFLNALPPLPSLAETFRKRAQLIATCHRSTKQIDYDVVLRIHKGEGKGARQDVRIHADLRTGRAHTAPDEPPPYAEEIFPWIRRFIADDAKIQLSEDSEFAFSRAQYQSAFSLPLVLSGPLNTTQSPIFEGAVVAGMTMGVRPNPNAVTYAAHFLSGTQLRVKLFRETDVERRKLLTIESDVEMLYTLAKASVRSKG